MWAVAHTAASTNRPRSSSGPDPPLRATAAVHRKASDGDSDARFRAPKCVHALPSRRAVLLPARISRSHPLRMGDAQAREWASESRPAEPLGARPGPQTGQHVPLSLPPPPGPGVKMPGRPLGEARREKPQKRRQADEGVVTRTRPGDECAVRGAQISCGGRRRLRRRRRPRRPGYGARRLRGAQVCLLLRSISPLLALEGPTLATRSLEDPHPFPAVGPSPSRSQKGPES